MTIPCSELVSVIIPTHNRALLLVEALESVYHQTYRPIEVIVIDDGSTDGTQETIKNLLNTKASTDFQILYLYQENKGPSAARNAGLRAASGAYIQFLDSDDLIHPCKIEMQVGLLKSQPGSQCIFSERFDFRGAPNWNETENKEKELIILDGNSFYCTFNTLTNSGLYTKEICFLAGLWNEEMSLCEDIEFNLRVLSLARTVLYTKNNWAAYRHHSGHQITTSFSTSESRYASLSGFENLQKTALFTIKNPEQKLFESIGILYNRLALDFMMSGDREGAIKTINSCRQMPLSKRRSRRLTYLNILAYLPASWMRLLWRINELYRASLCSKQT